MAGAGPLIANGTDMLFCERLVDFEVHAWSKVWCGLEL
jgi:hypothetical protein